MMEIYVALSGDDANGDGSPAHPFQTTIHALRVAESRDPSPDHPITVFLQPDVPLDGKIVSNVNVVVMRPSAVSISRSVRWEPS